jgi:hypothetical protein
MLAEEYILDLQARDLFELTEGEHSLLERSEPDQLVDKIIEGLVIIEQKDGVKVLGCEKRVYFNEMFV